MADNQNNSSQEKTEQPTQRKLDKAKEDGKAVTSKEMFVFSPAYFLSSSKLNSESAITLLSLTD